MLGTSPLQTLLFILLPGEPCWGLFLPPENVRAQPPAAAAQPHGWWPGCRREDQARRLPEPSPSQTPLAGSLIETPLQHVLRSGLSVQEVLGDKAPAHRQVVSHVAWTSPHRGGGAVVAGSAPTTFPSRREARVLPLFLGCPALTPWFQRWQRSTLPLAGMVAPQQSPFLHTGSSRAAAAARLAPRPPGSGLVN